MKVAVRKRRVAESQGAGYGCGWLRRQVFPTITPSSCYRQAHAGLPVAGHDINHCPLFLVAAMKS